jgi:hypothetical protein
MNETLKIDFVILWVDFNDPEWRARYRQYRPEARPEDPARFRDWGLLPYWFRAVEQYAPWVNKVYFVTSGERPKWLNFDCPKLVHIRHQDYIPAEYLPTFNSRTIELNIHRIPGLSEHFVFFNDDMFLNAPVPSTWFFRHGLPCDAPTEALSYAPYYNARERWGNDIVDFCNIGVLNTHFSRLKAVEQSPLRWFGAYLGLKGVITSLANTRTRRFQRFMTRHCAQPFLKTTFEEAWRDEYDWLHRTCSSRFRQDLVVNQWFLRYWQLAENRFYPQSQHDKCYIGIDENVSVDFIRSRLTNHHFKCVCLNDTPMCSLDKFSEIQPQLIDIFNGKFPQKSSFEK